MPPPHPQAATLAKTFEPIMLYHELEQALPIDPKWYLERCALWRAVPDTAERFDNNANWGEPPRTGPVRRPQLLKNKIAALATETSGGQTWIGTPGGNFGINTAPDPQHDAPVSEERFLEFVGWEVAPGPTLEEVTSSSINRHAAFTWSNYSSPLTGSRPWYYVEYLDHQDLLNYVDAPLATNGLDLFRSVVNDGTPQALLYYLFYPLHLESLEGCDAAGEGNLFATYAGEWACVALLLDSANQPTYIGLTSRNVGKPAIAIGAEDRRVGMTAVSWSQVQKVGNHPKILVALNTHSNYAGPDPGSADPNLHPVSPFSPPAIDPSRNSCGDVEPLDDVIAGQSIIKHGTPAPDTSPPAAWWVKAFLIPWGYLWLAGEAIFSSDHGEGTPDVLATPTPPVDQTGASKFRIIRPDVLSFPEVAGATSVTDWNVTAYSAPAPDGRSYDFVMDRTKQVWWAPRLAPRPGHPNDLPGAEGFSGRWGPRVTHDPNSRRAGMKCPDFLLMFLEAVALAKTM